MSNKKSFLYRFFGALCLGIFLFQAAGFAQKTPSLDLIYRDAKTRKGKRPVIVIPGILGSELIHSETKSRVWFKFSRSGKDDLRLPVAADTKSSRDKLIPGDVLRKVSLKILPSIKVYDGLIETLENYGGYTEASWDNPPEDLEDKFFVFPYDWRRDNVETAHLLIEKIEKIRQASKRPDLSFNVLAHSMGGLVARYALMYGKNDLPSGKPQPDWSGEKYFSKIFLFGTPNEGSVEAMQTLLEGRSSIGGGTDLPFVRNLSPVDIATMPAIFQLMPHQRTVRIFDENLKPAKVDLYDIETWRKYNWAIYSDEKYLKEFNEADRLKFEQYFALVLKRAHRFHEALDAYSTKRVSAGMFIIGSDCKTTSEAIVLHQDFKTKKWKTLLKPAAFTNSQGKKFSKEELEEIMLVPGDGRVSRSSLLAETLAENRRRSNLFESALPLTYALFICENHDSITSNLTVQNNFLTALVSEADK